MRGPGKPFRSSVPFISSRVMFVGITMLAHAYRVIPSQTETVVSQIARGTFGGRGLLYFCVQIATMLILVLAANTAYSDFPRLASIVSRDAYLPRQFANQGDRLAFSNGIVALSVFAGILLVVFKGDTHALIPLYMIGVFISFTLSQTGMVLHWRRLREPCWRTSALINGVGAIATGVVLVIVAATKALDTATTTGFLVRALRWFKARGTPIRDSEGRIIKWFGSCTDITDRKRAEANLPAVA